MVDNVVELLARFVGAYLSGNALWGLAALSYIGQTITGAGALSAP